MVILPMEFMTPADRRNMSAIEEQMAQLALEPMTATFEKPEDDKRQHLKALFLKEHVNGRPITRLLVDGGSAVNIMPYVMFRKLGKSDDDLTRIDMMLKDFEGNVSPTCGALCVDLTIGSKTLPLLSLLLMAKGPTICCSVVIGYTQIVASRLQCINASYNGSATTSR